MSELNRRRFLSIGAAAAGSSLIGFGAGHPFAFGAGQQRGTDVPDVILNPVEVSGAEAVPIIGRLPGARRMYVLSAGQGEFVGVGGHVLHAHGAPYRHRECLRAADVHRTAGRGHASAHAPGEPRRAARARRRRRARTGRPHLANAPRRLRQHPGRHAAWMGVEIRSIPAGALRLGRPRRRGVRGDGIAAGEQRGRTGCASRGSRRETRRRGFRRRLPTRAAGRSDAGRARVESPAARRTGPYVLLDGGGERFGGNTFLARNANTNGQFLFIITEGGPGGGVPAHFHARHFENFLGVDGETLGWAYGKAVPLKTGDYFQAPPRNLHGFRLNEAYNRFAAFLTPGIFEPFFTRGGEGRNGAGRQAPPARGDAGGAPPAGGRLQAGPGTTCSAR